MTAPEWKTASKPEPLGWSTWLVLAFAMIFPSVMGWLAFALVPPGQPMSEKPLAPASGARGREEGVEFSPGETPSPPTPLPRSGGEGRPYRTDSQPEASKIGPVAYYGGKLVQFSLPVVFLLLTTGRVPLPGRPSFRGLSLGVLFGLMTTAAILVLYHGFLRDSRVFRQSPSLIQAKLAEFGLDSPIGFAAIAGFITILHSLLEEYYWRWFVFGQLRRQLPFIIAMLLSSFFFAAFHAFSLNLYLPGHLFSAVLPFTACVGIGGGIWCWLYERTGSVYAPWISHLLVDASLFMVGYDLFFVRSAG